MCFTPTISLTTAIIEFILATILLLFFKKTTLRNFFAAIIYILGFYQFTEFMICSGANPELWALIGFSTYTFLPALGLHATLKLLKKEANIFLIYTIPVLSIIFAFSTSNFIINAECSTLFILVETLFYTSTSLFHKIIFRIYEIYYFGFILISAILFFKNYRKTKNKIRKEIDLIEISGILLMTIPTILLIVILPLNRIMLPSILCGFAIFVAIAAFISVYLEDKIKKKKK